VASDGKFVFHHPGGWTIPEHPQPLTVPPDERPGPDVESYESQWDGGPFDLATIVDVLLAEDGLLVPLHHQPVG
jgi:hypothetical protein